MVITREFIESLRTAHKGYTPRVIEALRPYSKTGRVCSGVIGVEIPDELAQYLVMNHKKQPLTEKQKVSKKNRKLLKKADKPTHETKSFIYCYIDNANGEKVNGCLIPKWVHEPIQWEMVRVRLMAMDYGDFLKTKYWTAISMYLKHKADGKCSRCGSTDNLNVHHKSYAHHGLELFYLDDLTVLCEHCHSGEHCIDKQSIWI